MAEEKPLDPLMNADEPVRTLIIEVMKIEQEYINHERPALYDELLKKIKEVIN